MPTSRSMGRRALRRLMPDLAPAITGGGRYYGVRITHAERLGPALVLDGEALRPGSRAANGADVLGRQAVTIRWRDGGRAAQGARASSSAPAAAGSTR